MPTPPKDYYRILQVDPAAEPEVIAAAYRRLSLKYHPDISSAAGATLRMQEINEAYEVLKEPAKRARYDRERNARSSGSTQADDERWREEAGAEWRRGATGSSENTRTEERRRAEYERQQREKAGKASGRAGETAEPGVHGFRAIPRGARVVKAFSREPVYCDGNYFQEHTVPGSYWIDVGFEWVARDVTTLMTTWPFIAVSVTVDGQLIESTQRQSKGPEEAVLPRANETRFGYMMTDALYVPPLALGDHTIVWTINFPRDIDDGWITYFRGTEIVITSLLHVVKTG